MIDEKENECEEDGNTSDVKVETEAKDIGATTTPPKATVPRTEKVAPITTSGIDTTANMDSEQKERFKKIQAKAQSIPQTIGTHRPFCDRREKHKLRKERRANRG